MTHSKARHRKHTADRRIVYNALDIAKSNAKKLSVAECNDLIALFLGSTEALREGVATEQDWCVVAIQLAVATEIEAQGKVRGMQGHFLVIKNLVQKIYDRATQTGIWKCTSLNFIELDALSLLIDLHKFQIKQLSRSEYLSAVNKLRRRIEAQ